MGNNVKVKVDLSGLNQLNRKLDEVSNTHEYQMGDVFTQDFMKNNTKFTDIDDFFNACGIFNEDDLSAFSRETLDVFVKENSNFSSWNEMKSDAGSKMITKKLGLD